MTQTLLLGSHLDSVPNGGRFDGGLGVMAAFEVLRTIRDVGIDLKVNLEAIDFTDISIEDGEISVRVDGTMHDALQEGSLIEAGDITLRIEEIDEDEATVSVT